MPHYKGEHMRDLQTIITKNDAAVYREYNQAVDDGNGVLALEIMRANPDLFPRRRPAQRVQSQREQVAS